MKLVFKSYKFRLYPNQIQQRLLNKHFGCVRWVYNYFLNQGLVEYQNTGKSSNRFRQQSQLPILKQEYIWLLEPAAHSLQYSIKNLEDAYRNFFKGKSNFPKFKSKKNKNSFTEPEGQRVIIKNNKLYFPKFREGINISISQTLDGKIKLATISKTRSGKYFVSILCEINYLPKLKSNNVIGIDLGLKEFLVASDGKIFQNHKFLRQSEDKLKRAQQHFSRKKKGSRNQERQRVKVARLHEKIANQRLDQLHKMSTQIVNENDIICVEDLNIGSMIKNRKLSKSISDVGWGEFLRQLQYKADWNDRILIKVNRFYPSSKTCFDCGYKNSNLRLSDRSWVCPNCNSILDRDLNAAKNIRKEGLNFLSTVL